MKEEENIIIGMRYLGLMTVGFADHGINSHPHVSHRNRLQLYRLGLVSGIFQLRSTSTMKFWQLCKL
jgi:hypothetical protein